ncbi:MAG: amidohydrolase family protein, partial [Gemmatimonadaceae bacterium]
MTAGSSFAARLALASVVACGVTACGAAAGAGSAAGEGSGAAAGAGQRASYALRGARILDPGSGTYSAPSVILVEGGRLGRVLPAAAYRADLADSTVDLSGKIVLPGLIDAHVHLSLGGPVRANALADLRAGFTTVVDLGAVAHRLLRIRDSINAGFIPGPRVLAAGMWIGVKGG